MADISVTIKSNVSEIIQALQEKEERALEECGLVAVGHAMEYVPRDTGNLAGSITHEVEADKGQVLIGSNVEYAPIVEFDEKARHKPPTSAHYLKRALADHIDEYQKVIARELQNLS